MLKKIDGSLVNTLLQWFLAYIYAASGGFAPDPYQGSAPVPLDPAGGLLSPVPWFCPPPKQISSYAPVCTDLLCIDSMTYISLDY